MDFDGWLSAAWTAHADDAPGVAARLSEGAARVDTETQWLALAHLAHHVHGEHLGQWDAGRACIDSLAGAPAYVDAGASGQARRRYLASLALSGGAADAADGLGISDRIRALAMAAGNLAQNEAAPDSVRAAALWSQAIDIAANSSLPASDPMHRTLAATGNGLACAMEEKPARTPQETGLMLQAAQAAREHWALAGSWLEVERADYRLAMSWLKAGDAARARQHAQACLDGIAANDGPAFERFFGWEAMARVRIALRDADAAPAANQMRAAFAALEPDDRAACAASLDAIETSFAAGRGAGTAGTSKFLRCDRSAAWATLQGHYQAHGRDFDLREAFARDPGRVDAMSVQAPEVFADLSKNLLDTATLHFLLDLARECGVEARRDAMLRGEPINLTEDRAVLHTALRAPRGAGPFSAEVHAVLDAMLAYAETVRDGAASGIRDIVNIGIGGSDLGPQMLVPALDAFVHPGLAFHFVSNVDGHDIAPVLRRLDPASTLFIVASKTFTTQETMANANAARAWFIARGGTDIARHFVATTTNVEAAARFGITRTFGFWDWVGGRYSLWSAIGLPVAIAIGAEHFRALLAGAHAMDGHFATAPAARNLPLLLGLIDVWYRNFHRFASRCVAPYHQGLRRLPAYLQQLEMESNGKRVDLAGETLPYATSPVVWGEPGTNGQHAFFQMLHQGTDVIPVEFIVVRHATHSLDAQHALLLANALAQSQALMQGKSAEVAIGERAPTASRRIDPATLARHRSFPGNRPSTTLLLDRLTPTSLGALIALYEHRVFTSGAVWGIDSFDQWGVELGKALCNDLLPRLASGDIGGLDASTAALIGRLRA